MQVLESANEIKERAGDWFEHASDYLEARWNLGVLDVSQKTANAISSLVSALILGAIGMLGLLFLSLGAAWLIGEKLQNLAAGFFIVALFYGVVGVVLYLVKDRFIKIPVVNTFIKKFYYEN